MYIMKMTSQCCFRKKKKSINLSSNSARTVLDFTLMAGRYELKIYLDIFRLNLEILMCNPVQYKQNMLLFE